MAIAENASASASVAEEEEEREKEEDAQGLALCKASAMGDEAKVRQLLLVLSSEGGADAAAASSSCSFFDSDGYTPLMYAAMNGHSGVLKLLLQAGAPWNALTPDSLSAGDFAMQHNHTDCFNLLLNAGLQAEMVLGKLAASDHNEGSVNSAYLKQRVSYSEDSLLDEEGKGVMMAWERPLMEAHARAVCGSCEAGHGHILNIGFGMGLVDIAIQSYNPVCHTIVEAHPDVYARMLQSGWADKPNVNIIFGRWQDVLPQLGTYDGIFFDTYGEYYEDMKNFHYNLPKLLKPGGIYSFFNGLCGDNAFFHVVYCQLVALDLAKVGYSTEFIPLPVKDCLDAKVWEAVSQKYWQLDTYYLPFCQESAGT